MGVDYWLEAAQISAWLRLHGASWSFRKPKDWPMHHEEARGVTLFVRKGSCVHQVTNLEGRSLKDSATPLLRYAKGIVMKWEQK